MCIRDSQFLNDRLRQRWGSKARRRSSDLKTFVSDRLNLQENPKIALMIAKNGENSIMFSDVVNKVNRRGKTKDLWMMITDGAVYLLEPHSGKLQHRTPLANISHISASQLPDNFFIIHVPSEQDRLFVSGRKTEVVTVLRIAYFDSQKQELNIALQNIIDYRVDRDQVRRVVFYQGEDGVYTKLFARRYK